ncbi:calcium-binding mitochondrial carrier protein SCaMC-2-A-like [Cimex lectularius]|uniref:Mitochondrial carrier protein n=1 Tax=Cimex lectularius TaxID=79782 RepID=A0A8I6RY01_CIMLE|nr:calcium-binding mitochondrial carrier protein SCaMC-2-A-like [Cimex lectularius]
MTEKNDELLSDCRSEKDDKLNSKLERIWYNVIAGATAGFVSRTLTAPLDRLKTMAQFQGRTIKLSDGFAMMIKEGGYASMWRGNGANLIKVVPEITLKFVFFNELLCLMQSDKRPTLKETLFAGALTGTFIQVIVHPVEVIKTKLVLRQSSESPRVLGQIKKGYKTYGWSFAYLGLVPAILGKMLFTSIDFAVYHACKRVLLSSPESVDKMTITFSGLCSSSVALIGAYPFGVLTTHRQASEKENMLKYIELLKIRGPFGMYRGFTTALLKIVPSYAIAYVCYESVLEIFHETVTT